MEYSPGAGGTKLGLSPFSTSTVPKRGVFLCLVSFQAELMTLGQKKTLRFGTVRLEWKTGLNYPPDSE